LLACALIAIDFVSVFVVVVIAVGSCSR